VFIFNIISPRQAQNPFNLESIKCHTTKSVLERGNIRNQPATITYREKGLSPFGSRQWLFFYRVSKLMDIDMTFLSYIFYMLPLAWNWKQSGTTCIHWFTISATIAVYKTRSTRCNYFWLEKKETFSWPIGSLLSSTIMMSENYKSTI
jgi:hypothetical protein